MGRAISRALREQVIQRSLAGQSSPMVADALGVSPRFVRALVKRFREEGATALHIYYHRCVKTLNITHRRKIIPK